MSSPSYAVQQKSRGASKFGKMVVPRGEADKTRLDAQRKRENIIVR